MEEEEDGSGDEEEYEGEYDESLLKENYDDSENYDDYGPPVDDGDYEYQDMMEIDGEDLGDESILSDDVFTEEPEIIEEGMEDGYYVEDGEDQDTDSQDFPDDLMPVD